ncbi:MAG: PAS domain S-box protein [Chloroflexi bacterium]|nr:PAS domain S-box protein [Chloroflexota bacterium]
MPGGAATRLMMCVIIVIVPLFGWLAQQGERLGFVDEDNVAIVLVTLRIVFLTLAVYVGGGILIREEERTAIANRLYAMLSQVNQNIVRIRESRELFNRICEVGVVYGSFDLVWIGAFDEDGQTLHVAAFCGMNGTTWLGDEFAIGEEINLPLAFSQSIRVGEAVTYNNLTRDPQEFPFRQQAEQRQLRSFASLPLYRHGQIFGILSVYAEQPNLFTPAEIRLLTEISGDIGFALETIEDEKQRKRGEEELRATRELFQAIFHKSPVATALSKLADRTIVDVSRATEKLFGYMREELIGKPSVNFDYWMDAAERQRAYEIVLKSGRLWNYEFSFKTKFGTTGMAALYIETVEQRGEKYFLTIFIDITERKRAEAAILERERQMTALVTSLDDIVFEFDEQGIYLNVWTADESKLAQPTAQVLGRGIDDVLGEETGRPFIEAVRHAIFEGHTEIIEYPLQVIGGQRWFMARVNPILAPDGSHQTASMLVRDITERKKNEKLLRQWADAFENCTHGIAIGLPTTNQVLTCNPSFARMQGRGIEEIASMPILSMYAPEDHEHVKQHIAKADQMGSSRYEAHMVRKDGSQYLVQMDIVSVRDQTGSLLYRVATQQDITERKRAEEALRESEEKFSTLFEEAPFAISLSVLPNGVIVNVNESFERMFGYARQEAIGKTSLELGINPNMDVRKRVLAELNDHGFVHNLETALRTKSGEPRFFSVNIDYVNIDSQKYILNAAQDITERKQRERERETLLALATVLRAAPTRAEMIPTILDQIILLLTLDGAALALLGNSSGEIVVELARGGLEAWNHLRIPLGQGITGMVMASGETYVTNDLNSDPNNYRTDLIEGEICVACAPLIADRKTIGALWIKSISHMQDADIRLLEGIANMAAIAIHRTTLFEQTTQYASRLTDAYEENIEGWSRALDLRDRETEGHTQRVTALTLKMARIIGIPEANIVHIRRGALLHDIGKMGVPDHILLKPGKLTDEEWAQMRQHPVFAYELLSPIEFLHEALDIPYCHHEKWDGTGYPRGLKGEEIPLSARLFAVVDVWDALTSNRPYRKGWSREKTLAYIQEQSGTHFDPRAVEIFLMLIRDV